MGASVLSRNNQKMANLVHDTLSCEIFKTVGTSKSVRSIVMLEVLVNVRSEHGD